MSFNRSHSAAPIPWQLPNATEAYAAEKMGNTEEYVALPWATWIDRIRRGLDPEIEPYQQFGLCNSNISIQTTVCQHIWALDHLDLFQSAGITDLFWSHATRNCQKVNGIRIHPFPLYPVRCSSHPPPLVNKSPWQRPLLYSFQGAYAAGLYLTPVREWILKLPSCSNSLLQRREEWHYEQAVYREQVLGQATNITRAAELEKQASAYAGALQQSCFAFCPSGSGPNSIRLWEALGYGTIPVIMSDQLLLPGSTELWQQAALFVPETEARISDLPAELKALADQHQCLASMQAAGKKLWMRYGLGGFVADVEALIHDPHTILLNRTRSQCNEEPWVLEASQPAELPIQVTHFLLQRRTLQTGKPLLIHIVDQARPDLLNVRWRVALEITAQLLRGVKWLTCSTSPHLEAWKGMNVGGELDGHN